VWERQASVCLEGLGGGALCNVATQQATQQSDSPLQPSVINPPSSPQPPSPCPPHPNPTLATPQPHPNQPQPNPNQPQPNPNPNPGFANWGFVATVRKEGEPDSSSIYSQADLSRAPVRLQNFVNGEPARNQDLVAWVSSGLYHIPISEDAPVTPTLYNHLGFLLVPFNYHDENAAMDMADLFQIDNENAPLPPVQAYASDSKYQCTPQFDSMPFSGKWDPN